MVVDEGQLGYGWNSDSVAGYLLRKSCGTAYLLLGQAKAGSYLLGKEDTAHIPRTQMQLIPNSLNHERKRGRLFSRQGAGD